MLRTQQVLDIPELWHHIVHFLDLDGRRACALVSKAWYNDFQPFVWESFSVSTVNKTLIQTSHGGYRLVPRSLTTPDEEQELRLASLRKHAHLIRHLRRHWLSVSSSSPQLRLDNLMQVLLEQCRSLVSFEGSTSHLAQLDWDCCKELVRRNHTTLQWVDLKWVASGGNPLTDVACHHPWQPTRMTSLRRIVLGCSTVLISLARLVEACPVLEDLVVGGIIWPYTVDDFKRQFPLEDDIVDLSKEEDEEEDEDEDGEEKKNKKKQKSILPLDPSSTRPLPWGLRRRFGLRKLQIEYECWSEDLGIFLMLCPLLHTLILDDMQVNVRDKVLAVIRQGYLPNLTSLTLGTGKLDEGLSEALLEALPIDQIQNLHCRGMTAEEVEKLQNSLKNMQLDHF
ncbi:hypothetical protein BGZ73_002206 [Actinomortierella ambigua]|nr:hypothetical protein BGZ73_002206 [Actinomortierella ambigua]